MLNVKSLILLDPGSSHKSTQIIPVSVSNWFKSKKESLQASHSAHFGKNILILSNFTYWYKIFLSQLAFKRSRGEMNAGGESLSREIKDSFLLKCTWKPDAQIFLLISMNNL